MCIELKCTILSRHFNQNYQTMKTLLISFTIVCFSCVFTLNSQAQATPQLTKGSLLIGTTTALGGDFYDFEHLGGGNTAGLSFGSTWSSNGSTSEKTKYTSYNLTPRVGYFFMDGLAAGTEHQYQRPVKQGRR